jgi:hypothetical protein
MDERKVLLDHPGSGGSVSSVVVGREKRRGRASPLPLTVIPPIPHQIHRPLYERNYIAKGDMSRKRSKNDE